MFSKNLTSIGLVVLAIQLAGCSLPFLGGYGEKGLSREEFTRYVESVFRLQNSLTSQVMTLMEEDDNNPRFAPLVLAEENMHKACRYLNEYAAHDADGSDSSFMLQHRVEKTAEDCKSSAKQLEQVLAKYRR